MRSLLWYRTWREEGSTFNGQGKQTKRKQMPPMFFIGISPSLQMTAAFGLGLLKTLTLSKINMNQSMDDYNFYCLFLDQQAYRPATPIFQLALRGYSVASLPRALRFVRAFCALRSRKFLKIKSQST